MLDYCTDKMREAVTQSQALSLEYSNSYVGAATFALCGHRQWHGGGFPNH